VFGAATPFDVMVRYATLANKMGETVTKTSYMDQVVEVHMLVDRATPTKKIAIQLGYCFFFSNFDKFLHLLVMSLIRRLKQKDGTPATGTVSHLKQASEALASPENKVLGLLTTDARDHAWLSEAKKLHMSLYVTSSQTLTSRFTPTYNHALSCF
jgi:hypothetical protein